MSDAQPVFDAIVKSGLRLFPNDAIFIALPDNGMIRPAAMAEKDPARAEAWKKRFPFPLTREYMHGLAILDRRTVDIADIRESPPDLATGAKNTLASGYHAVTVVPMMRGGEAIGALSVIRLEPGPLSDKQRAALRAFADQAVIAIENARLLSELRQRTEDLTESLQQQTATADVLKVISRSTFDLQIVLDALTKSAAQLCDADMGAIMRETSKVYYYATNYNFPPDFSQWARSLPVEPGRGSVVARILLDGKIAHIADVLADSEYTFFEAQQKAGYRTLLGVPLLREGKVIGVMVLSRTTVRPFTDRQIALATGFADQAVIAIENVRLFDELQARTREVSETLEYQTATGDVLNVISRSPFDLQPVLDTIVQIAARLCSAEYAFIAKLTEGKCRLVAANNMEAEHVKYIANNPVSIDRGSVIGRVVLQHNTVHVRDVLEDLEFRHLEWQKVGRQRTVLGIPLLREDVLIGVIILARTAVKPFTDKQVELVSTFADQAVIAIENVRLFDEIQEKSRQLEEASKHKSQFLANMSHELRTPLNAIIGYTELIIDGIYGDTPEKAQAVLKRVESNGRHLLALINDVLDFSKIEAGQLKLTLAAYSMKDVVYNVFSAVEPLAAKKSLALKIEVPPDLPAGHGDERKLTQVILNLVGNAIKFTDTGEVGIRVAPAKGSFSVAVYDTGPGIDPANQEKLFEEFQQADNSITKAKGGTGLGLAISRRIIEMHGGRLWVDSSLGHGSVFTFEIPSVVETVGSA